MAELLPTPLTSCGLALALPMNLHAIERALDGGPYADYVRPGAAIGPANVLWEESFRAVAEAAHRLARGAAELGVMVCENASLADLGCLFQNCRVITVVAHWRGARIVKEDLVQQPSSIINRLTKDPSGLPVRFRQGCDTDWLDRLDRLEGEVTDSMRCSRLAEILNSRMLRTPVLKPPPAGTEWYMDLSTLKHENRAALDAWWPEAFKPGNRLELADGLHSPDQLGEIVPWNWAGVADLSSCQSAQLIDVIKQNRHDRVVIANELETKALSRLSVLTAVYKILSTSANSYVDVRKALAAKMSGR